jgi:S1-C subfamily serine protease
MRFVAVAFVVLLAACCASVPDMAGRTRGEVLRLDVGQGVCTAAAVGPATLLTAHHCIGDAKAGLFVVDGKTAGFAVLADDGHDHVLLRTTVRFEHWASIRPVPPPGSTVYLWGNPAGLEGVLRVGRIAGDVKATNCLGIEPGPCSMLLLDLNATFGDSGAPIFDTHGRIVAMQSGSLTFRGWAMAYAYRFHFTPEQLAAARL